MFITWGKKKKPEAKFRTQKPRVKKPKDLTSYQLKFSVQLSFTINDAEEQVTDMEKVFEKQITDERLLFIHSQAN